MHGKDLEAKARAFFFNTLVLNFFLEVIILAKIKQNFEI